MALEKSSLVLVLVPTAILAALVAWLFGALNTNVTEWFGIFTNFFLACGSFVEIAGIGLLFTFLSVFLITRAWWYFRLDQTYQGRRILAVSILATLLIAILILAAFGLHRFFVGACA